MKLNSLISLKYVAMATLFIGCTSDDPVESLDCVTGVLVGQKCNVFSLQLTQGQTIPSETWQKGVNKNGNIEYEPVDNVIGLLKLPDAYQKEGLKLFLSLRRATAEENDVPCYTDLPNPASPRYVVLAVDSLKCPVSLNK
jgi:hypothetical protein